MHLYSFPQNHNFFRPKRYLIGAAAGVLTVRNSHITGSHWFPQVSGHTRQKNRVITHFLREETGSTVLHFTQLTEPFQKDHLHLPIDYLVKSKRSFANRSHSKRGLDYVYNLFCRAPRMQDPAVPRTVRTRARAAEGINTLRLGFLWFKLQACSLRPNIASPLPLFRRAYFWLLSP